MRGKTIIGPGAVADLRDRMDAMDDRFSALERRVDGHAERFTQIEETLSRLVSAVSRQGLLLDGIDKKLNTIVGMLGGKAGRR